MLTRLTRAQLAGFVLVTVVGVTIMGGYYAKLPEQFGVGRYDLTVQLAQTGGLYERAAVTYRGHEVGVVTSVKVRDPEGVEAVVSIDDDVKIPESVQVEVRSASVIGEQYLNFVPDGEGSAYLADGDVVDVKRTSTPVSTSELLASANEFLSTLPTDDLRTTVDELGAALTGNGEAIGSIIDDSTRLQAEASASLDETLALIRDLGPVLSTQQRIAPDLTSWADSLATVTGQLATSDQDIARILQSAAPLGDQTSALMSDLYPILPTLLSDLGATAEVANTYLPSIKHILVVLPAAMEALNSGVPKNRRGTDAPLVNLSFKANVGDPPVCTEGFEFADQIRSPKDLSPAPPPLDSYCKVAPGDRRVPRGARSNLCPDGVTRGATAADCGLIFDPASVKRSRLRASNPRPATDNPDGAASPVAFDEITGRLLAPNGDFYLIDDATRASPYQTLGDLMTRLTAR